MRSARVLVLLAAALGAAACGAGTTATSAAKGTLGAELARPGPDVALIQGTSDYATGPVRVTFLVIDSKSRSIERPHARVWVGPSLEAPPTVSTEATLEPIGVPGLSSPASGGVSRIYVARFELPRPGTYTLVAEPDGARIQGLATLRVGRRPQAPAVGDKAIASRTPTLASAHGDAAELTTASPPDLSLLRYSVADTMAAHVPFVLVFATPKFCTSRTCGPVVDVARAVQRRFAGSDVRFIHVEVYEDNNPAQGFNRWFREWRLPSEPWVFLVGRDGRIEQRFEGSVSVAELSAAVRRLAR
ncbi:MAG: hypothetical protein ACM3QU_08980 [Verrucomicrobiota bacterium]